MSFRHLLPLLLVVFIVAACAPAPDLRDDQFLNDTSLIAEDAPCEAPCWQGITPGETSWNEAQTILEDLPMATNLDVQATRNDERLVNFEARDGRQCCRVYAEDGETVTDILTLLAPQMTLGQVIEVHGEPTYVQGEDVDAEQTFISAVYRDVPMVVYVFGAGMATGELSAESEIVGVTYLTSDNMQELIRINDLYTWDGYGALSEIFDSNIDKTAAPATEEATE